MEPNNHDPLPDPNRASAEELRSLGDSVRAAVANFEGLEHGYYVRGRKPQPVPGFRPTVCDMSKAFNLNREQHVTLTAMCANFLMTIVGRYRFTEEAKNDIEATLLRFIGMHKNRQVIAVIQGQGGSGKSYVLAAFVQFCHQWQASDAIALTATTNMAALLIGGGTWYKALGLGVASRKKEQRPLAAADELYQKWQLITMLCIDEVSALNPSDTYHTNMVCATHSGVHASSKQPPQNRPAPENTKEQQLAIRWHFCLVHW